MPIYGFVGLMSWLSQGGSSRSRRRAVCHRFTIAAQVELLESRTFLSAVAVQSVAVKGGGGNTTLIATNVESITSGSNGHVNLNHYSSPSPVTTLNWSGYAATNGQSDSVTDVIGSWTVPKVTGKTTAYSSAWVGVDGFNGNTVEQIGTDEVVNAGGSTSYSAWYEMYSTGLLQPQQDITGMTIRPGDSITAQVRYVTTGAYAGDFLLSIVDSSRSHDSFSIYESSSATQSPLAQRSTAEWVMEAPTVGTIAPLANFGTISFSNALATINGITGPINDSDWQSFRINMTNGISTEARTSSLEHGLRGSRFSVTFVTPCRGVSDIDAFFDQENSEDPFGELT